MNIESLLSEMDPVLDVEIPDPDLLDARRIAATPFDGGAGPRVSHTHQGWARRVALTAEPRRQRVALAILAVAAIVAAAALDHKGSAVDPRAIGNGEEVRPLP